MNKKLNSTKSTNLLVVLVLAISLMLLTPLGQVPVQAVNQTNINGFCSSYANGNQAVEDLCVANFDDVFCRDYIGISLGEDPNGNQQYAQCINGVNDAYCRDSIGITNQNDTIDSTKQQQYDDCISTVDNSTPQAGSAEDYCLAKLGFSSYSEVQSAGAVTAYDACETDYPNNLCLENLGFNNVSEVDAAGVRSAYDSCVSSNARNFGSGQAPARTTVDLPDNPIYIRLLEIVNFLAAGVGVVVIIAVAIGGIQYMTSAGNPQRIQAARTRIVNAFIALGLYIFMYAVIQWLIPGGIF